MVTGYDLVFEQFKIALGLGKLVDMSKRKKPGIGYAMELRVLAEELVGDKFYPCPGKITDLKFPRLPYLRLECAVGPGSELSEYFDSTMFRMIISGHTMQELFVNAKKVVNDTHVSGIRQTNLDTIYRPLFNTPSAVNKMLNQQYGLNDLVGILPTYKGP